MNDQCDWEFSVDADFTGNAEVQNTRGSQLGILALLNSAPVYWKSSVIQCYSKQAPIYKKDGDLRQRWVFSSLLFRSAEFSLCFLILRFPLSDPPALGIHLFSSY